MGNHETDQVSNESPRLADSSNETQSEATRARLAASPFVRLMADVIVVDRFVGYAGLKDLLSLSPSEKKAALAAAERVLAAFSPPSVDAEGTDVLEWREFIPPETSPFHWALNAGWDAKVKRLRIIVQARGMISILRADGDEAEVTAK